MVKSLSALSICHGIKGYSTASQVKGGIQRHGTWYSKTCEAIGSSLVCTFCKKLHLTLQKQGCRHIVKKPTNSTNSIKRKMKYYQKKSSQLSRERKLLRSELVQIKTSLHQLSLEKIEIELQTADIPLPMKSNILHSLQTIKVKCSKGLR